MVQVRKAGKSIRIFFVRTLSKKKIDGFFCLFLFLFLLLFTLAPSYRVAKSIAELNHRLLGGLTLASRSKPLHSGKRIPRC